MAVSSFAAPPEVLLTRSWGGYVPIDIWLMILALLDVKSLITLGTVGIAPFSLSRCSYSLSELNGSGPSALISSTICVAENVQSGTTPSIVS